MRRPSRNEQREAIILNKNVRHRKYIVHNRYNFNNDIENNLLHF